MPGMTNNQAIEILERRRTYLEARVQQSHTYSLNELRALDKEIASLDEDRKRGREQEKRAIAVRRARLDVEKKALMRLADDGCPLFPCEDICQSGEVVSSA